MDQAATTNMTNESFTLVTEEPQLPSSKSDVVLPIIFGCIGSLGICGNGLVCFVFLFEKRVFGSVTSTLILNQSIIDLCTSVVFVILKFASGIAVRSSNWFSVVCYIWISEFPFWSLSYASTFNLTLLSLERYFAICRPIKHKSAFTKLRAKLYCMIVWAIGFVLQVYLPTVHHIAEDRQCLFAWPNKAAQKFVGSYVFFLEYFIPLFIIIGSYASIWLALRKRVNSDQVQVASFSRAKKNVTITLFMVGICFIICWSPDAIVFFYFNLGGYYSFQSVFHHFVMVFVMCNMCINPIIYCLKYDKFRRTVLKLFCGGRELAEIENSANTQVSTITN
ncbi:galanin receptor 2b-like [Amphiura filiformis]|uniref:galanin receptor 2b-like n=1 Tax=Amphiura filiformis TaxID=82378 RepID=UPI003B214205